MRLSISPSLTSSVFRSDLKKLPHNSYPFRMLVFPVNDLSLSTSFPTTDQLIYLIIHIRYQGLCRVVLIITPITPLLSFFTSHHGNLNTNHFGSFNLLIYPGKFPDFFEYRYLIHSRVRIKSPQQLHLVYSRFGLRV
jgi:hypothetical protein